MEVALFGALVSALGFGLANIVIKKALSTTSIPQTLISSMVSGSIFLLILVLLGGFPNNVSPSLVVTLAAFALGEACLYLSLYKAFDAADVSVASGIIGIYPIISTVFTVLILGESISPEKVVFILLMVIGAIFIGLNWKDIRARKLGTSRFMKGLPWALLCLFLHSIYFPALGSLTASGQWEFKLLGIKIFAVIVLGLIFMIIKKNKFIFTKNKLIAGALLGFLEVLGWIGISFASSNSIGMIGIIVALGSSAPLITAIVARFYLKEKLHILQYAGIVIVVVGLTLIAVV